MNPFIYNQPVKGDDFYNREKVVDHILKEVAFGKTQGNVWITGERQVGKTSLLQYIQLFYADYKEGIRLYGTDGEYKIAFIFANVQHCLTKDDFFNTLEIGIKNYFDYKFPDSSDYFQKIIEYLYKTEKIYTIFLIDEFDAFIQNLCTSDKSCAEGFLSGLASTLQGVSALNNARPFGFVFTANHNIKELVDECGLKQSGSGLIVESIELDWFNSDQVSKLAKHYLKDDNNCFDQNEIDFCYKIAKGYPYFTQKLFALMYDLRAGYGNKKSFFKEVKSLYGNDFAAAIKGWGGNSMPKRTLLKVKELANNPDIKKALIDAGLTILKSSQ